MTNPTAPLDRRSFCRRALAAASLPLIGSTAVAGPFTGKIYKAVKATMIRGDMPLLDKFKMSQDVGFDGISLMAPGRFDLREAMRAQDITGLRIHNVNDAVHWQVRLSDPDEAVRAKALEAMKDTLNYASDCGASSILLVIGKVTDPKNENHEQVRQRSTEQIRKAIPLASRLGVRILCENVGNGFCADAQQWAEYLDSFASPWVGAFFDIGNHHGYGGADHWIRTLGLRTVKIDIKDRNMDKNKNCNLFDGHVDWAKIRKELKAQNFTGWATAEVGGGGKERLREVVERMDKALGI
ncbi:MAG: L-ribulose-5-phosphate 3-epimerase [Candidatus Binatia bacterium]|jgi:L-ribulose-5-phosphate 3-epimerase